MFVLPFDVSQAQDSADAPDTSTTPNNPKVLIINGSWNAGAWDLEVTSGIVNAIRQGQFPNAEVSIQYLGLSTLMESENSRVLMYLTRAIIRGMVEAQDIDMIVSIAASAGDLTLDLTVGEEVPKLLLLPSRAAIEAAHGRTDVAVVESAAAGAIESTIEQILALRPQTETIHILGGSNADNLIYVQLTRQIMQLFDDRIDFHFHLGEHPDEMGEKLSSLGDSDSILALPISSYTAEDGELVTLGPTAYQTMLETLPHPVFGMYDTFVGIGLTGGRVSSTLGYSRTVAELLEQRLLTGEWPRFLTPGESDIVYDWNKVNSFNLNLNRLNEPYSLINEPTTLFDTNPILVIVSVNVLVLLVALICIMALMLDRSRKAARSIAASEKLARENEERYKLLATNTVDVIWTWDINTRRVIYCSPAIEKLSGFTPEEIMEMRIDQIFTPESAEHCLTFYADVKNPRNELIEIEHYTKSGDTIWCELAAHPINDDSPNLWVGATRDISQRKRSEEHHAKLEASVRQNQKFESLGTLAGGIAHDFNNILTVMVGLVEMLGKRKNQETDVDGIVAKLGRSTDQATRLVQRILTFSRQKEGVKAVLDMAELTRECAEFLETGVPPQVTLTKKIPEANMAICADKTQVEQIILNIITNAIEALGDSGGNISIALTGHTAHNTTEMKHGVLKPGLYAKLSIVDNGSGIPEDQMEKIFDPFHSSKELGNGMGLAIVRSIIIEHEGAIGLESTAGRGTTFDVYLPLTSSALETEAPSTAVETGTESLKILVIDDQENVLEVAEMLLENLGHQCVAISDPIVAFDYIKQHHEELDMVITDYSMPKLNGIQIVKFCQKHYPNLPAILSTGYGETMSLVENAARDSRDGKMKVLKKPYSYTDLRNAIEEVSAATATLH